MGDRMDDRMNSQPETIWHKRQRLADLIVTIKALKIEINQEEVNCEHLFPDKDIYDPEMQFKFDNDQYHQYWTPGSDPISSSIQSEYKEILRWRRTCSICGYIEYTKKTKVVKHEPDFS